MVFTANRSTKNANIAYAVLAEAASHQILWKYCLQSRTIQEGLTNVR